MKNDMTPNVLAGNAFLVKEHVGLLKAANNYTSTIRPPAPW